MSEPEYTQSDRRTPGGARYDYFEPSPMPGSPAFVVLVVGGEYQDVYWRVKYVADSLDDVAAWIDGHPIPRRRQECYEVHVGERLDENAPPEPIPSTSISEGKSDG